MKPLVKWFVLFCLVGIVLSRPVPEDEEPEADEGGEEEKTDDAGGEEEETDGDDADGDDAGKEEEEKEGGGDDDNGKGKDEGGDNAGDEEGAKEDGADDTKGKGDSTGNDEGGDNADSGKKDPVNTYKQVVALLEKDTKVDHIKSEYLRSALNNDLQSEVRNPVIEAIGRIGDFSKIQECFKSMGADVKKVVSGEEKTFKSCMTKKKSEYQCSEDSFAAAKGKLSPITSKIKSCVSSKGN